MEAQAQSNEDDKSEASKPNQMNDDESNDDDESQNDKEWVAYFIIYGNEPKS